MQCSRTVLVATTLLSLLALLACSLVFYTYSSESCPEGAFPCANSSLCIPQHSICNHHDDCPMADDEDPVACADAYGYTDEFIGNLRRSNVSNDCMCSSVCISSNIVKPKPLTYTITPGIDIFKAMDVREQKTCVFQVLDYLPSECDCGDETALWCKGKGLTTVPQNVSQNVGKMILANNTITLTDDSFANYCCITIIHLEGNGLKTLPDGVFHNQTKLGTLLLQGNQLEVLPECVFCGLPRLKWLFLHDNKLNLLNLRTWTDLSNLQWIELTHNEITLDDEVFPYLESLKMINLAYNKIEILRSDTFSQLIHLSELDLRGNQVQFIHEDAFHNLKILDYLDLSHNRLHTLDEVTFNHLHSLDKLMLGHNPLQEVPKRLFRSLGNLSSLDLQDIEIEHIDTTMFYTMKKLDFVYFKQFYYCSYAPNVPKCTPNSDGISSFEHLLSKPIQRITVWLVAVFTCGANILVILGRFSARDENQALSFVVRNLAGLLDISDFLMGIYLTVIAYQDLKFRGNYNNHAHQWMSSGTCTMIGITAMISSEVSVLILAFLSLERFLLIAVPFSGHQTLNQPTAVYSMMTIWVVGVIIAVAPVLHWQNSTRFYGANGLCFPLHINIPYLMGWQYSAFVFLGINTTVMVLMVIVYSAMFLSIVKTRTATTINLGDSEFAIRFFLVVLTDACCWAPITVIKILALCRVPIPGSLYAWVVVFVLPVNSALNPLLYTFITPKYCKIIKDLGNIVSKKSRKNARKHLSADTESSQCSVRKNVYLTAIDKRDHRDWEASTRHLQSAKLNTYAEETI